MELSVGCPADHLQSSTCTLAREAQSPGAWTTLGQFHYSRDDASLVGSFRGAEQAEPAQGEAGGWLGDCARDGPAVLASCLGDRRCPLSVPKSGR